MPLSLLQLGNVTSSTNKTLEFLRDHQLLKTGKLCDKCGIWMSHLSDSSKQDSYVWRCNSCRSKVSIRSKSFWDTQKLTLQAYLTILYLFSMGVPGHQAARMLEGEATLKSIYDWYNLYRDIMSQTLLESPFQLGGIGKVVEIDESKWGRKRKYNVGRIPPQGTWIFGLIQRDSSKVALLCVKNRSADELIPLITRIVVPGTTIVSDQWAAYNSLSQHGYVHHTVNHSENFVDPVSGFHTQTIEGFWGLSKSSYKTMRGASQLQLPSHLDEIVFRWNNKDKCIFNLLLSKIAQFHQVEDKVDHRQYPGKPVIVYKN